MAKQLDLLNFHRNQFERVLNAEIDTSYLPQQMKDLMTNGLRGIKNYQEMLEAAQQRYKSLSRDNALSKQMQSIEGLLSITDSELNSAEQRMKQLTEQLEPKKTVALNDINIEYNQQPDVPPGQPSHPQTTKQANIPSYPGLRDTQEKRQVGIRPTEPLASARLSEPEPVQYGRIYTNENQLLEPRRNEVQSPKYSALLVDDKTEVELNPTYDRQFEAPDKGVEEPRDYNQYMSSLDQPVIQPQGSQSVRQAANAAQEAKEKRLEELLRDIKRRN